VPGFRILLKTKPISLNSIPSGDHLSCNRVQNPKQKRSFYHFDRIQYLLGGKERKLLVFNEHACETNEQLLPR
jgi:hypothetical protein